MKPFITFVTLLICFSSIAQDDSTDLIALSKVTVLSEVVIRTDLNTVKLLKRIKEDSSFYKAFRNLRVLGFTSINDIKMLDKKGKIQASLFSKTRQNRSNGCRTMEVLEEKTTGDMYDEGELNYFTAELYAGLFFTKGRICGENNIVAGTARNVKGKSGIEKRKEQLKMMFFNPGKRIPGIPFIGDKIDIFNPEVSQYYNFAIDLGDLNGRSCYIFRITPREDLTSSERNNIVFKNITTWFDEKSMDIIARNYNLSYDTPVYDFDVNMEVQMTKVGDLLVPQVLRYKGNWKLAFQKRERALFTATLFDFRD
ncbi:MAG TPA: hypothetical protein VM368_06035 [Flavisolibacter sp.]|nr:hypothetical protein [Flavisolibacter sp.]